MLCFTMLALSSCVNTRWLKTREYLLYQQNITGNEEVSTEELEVLYKQLPNRKVPIIGSTLYLYFHLLGREFYHKKNIIADSIARENKDSLKLVNFLKSHHKNIDGKDTLVLTKKDSSQLTKIEKKHQKKMDKIKVRLKEGNFFMRTIGEAPSLFDTTNISKTVSQMHLYLNSKGFFKNTVSYDTTRLGKNYFVKYIIHEGSPSMVDSIKYAIEDTTVAKVLAFSQMETLLKTGTRYDEKVLNNERERINKFLKENGYYDFTRQYINFEIDTTDISKLILTLMIDLPPNGNKHIRYQIDKVNYYFDYSKTNKIVKDSASLNDIQYFFYNATYSSRVLNSKNSLIPGSFYSYSQSQNTQKNIANLEMFKFVGVNFIKSDTSGNKLTAVINATSLPKYQLSDEWGVNVGQGQGYPGPMANLTFVDRNIFGGCEIFDINLRGSVEGQPSLTKLNQVYTTYEYGGSVAITSPKVLIPTRFKYRFNNNNPKTKYVFSYQNTIRNEYTRGIIKGSINYLFQKGKFSRITVTPLDLSVVNTTSVEKTFQDKLNELKQKGNNLQNSFSRSFISNFTINYQFSNADNQVNKTSSYLKISGEIGGLTLHLLNNAFGDQNNIILEDGEFLKLKVYNYIRFAADYRKYIAVGKNRTVAFRLNGGYITPYGGSKDVPYEKYFFAGGSNSIRAWQPRRLGPGAYAEYNSVTGKYSYETERQGTILMEGSIETRFKIIKFVDGALFIDAGNIWNNLSDSVTISSFQPSTFFKQFGVGAGYGLRFNFTFFIVRFDFGYKIWDPSRPVNERYRGNKITFKSPLGETDQMVFQLGIGYPF